MDEDEQHDFDLQLTPRITCEVWLRFRLLDTEQLPPPSSSDTHLIRSYFATMFGCCVAGRLPQTNMTQIDETHVTFSIPNASAVGHVVIFLLGTVPFPPGYAATIHFQWPGKPFQLLGMVSNEKPSAIFRLRGAGADNQSTAGLGTPMSTEDITATLGISIETVDVVQAQVAALKSSSGFTQQSPANTSLNDPVVLAERIVKHLFNHLSSFEMRVGPQTVVPLGVIQKWYDALVHKLKAGGAGFLMND